MIKFGPCELFNFCQLFIILGLNFILVCSSKSNTEPGTIKKLDNDGGFLPKNNAPLQETKTKQNSLLPKTKGNTVEVDLYIESRCPDTTGFVKRQLLPTFQKLRTTNRVNYTIIPFGKAKCDRIDDDFVCECQHGEKECLLNQLMNCVIDRYSLANVHIPIICCIQGQSDLTSASQNCLAESQDLEWLMSCTNGKRGRYLHANAGQKTKKLGDAFNFVPWIVIDGNRVNDAFYSLEENICKRLDVQKPIQCEHFV